MTAILDRFKEPSSWAGLTGILALFGAQIDPGAVMYIINTLAGIAGTLAFFMKEKTS